MSDAGLAGYVRLSGAYCTVTVMFMLEWILQVTLKVPAVLNVMSTD